MWNGTVVDTVTGQRVHVGSYMMPVGTGGIQHSEQDLVRQENFEFEECYLLPGLFSTGVAPPITVPKFPIM